MSLSLKPNMTNDVNSFISNGVFTWIWEWLVWNLSAFSYRIWTCQDKNGGWQFGLVVLHKADSGLEQVEETVAEGLRRLQVEGAIEQVHIAAQFTNAGSMLVEETLWEQEIVRYTAEAHNPAREDDSGDEEEPKHPISTCGAL
ncbi:hypothetical protein BJ878DRAFT_569631 [Calycina marina]|uniref:Uncharacterized protein n=1 Tax=Calycina marina TaxID=1763456 RepID=A0A9P7YY03_9HELO|nr:hypothetical protein BJ878DRAFT_569631 [Calycina marina]